MRRPDKGLRLTASRLLESWTAGERGKRPALAKRKLRQDARAEGDEAVEAIYDVIRRIPRGWVATYGQVAAMAGLPSASASRPGHQDPLASGRERQG
jgi:methylated-DNA-protein-cysteine methyltransferase-like protein